MAETSTVDLNLLAQIEEQIWETNISIVEKRNEEHVLGQKLNLLLDAYKAERQRLQKIDWQNRKVRVCPKCNNLKPADDFKYLYLECSCDSGSGFEARGHRAKREIWALCAECYDKILTPAHYAYLYRRLPVERQGGKLFIDWDGRKRAFEDVFAEVERGKIPIIEEPHIFPISLCSIGRNWDTELQQCFTTIVRIP